MISALTLVVFRKGISVDYIKSAYREEFLAVYKVLPIPFQYFDTWLSVPAKVFHAL